MFIGDLLLSTLPSDRMYEFNLNWFLNKFNELRKKWDDTEAAWLALKEYVENFFDDLDVQEEINNKLDEMYESGKFSDIIGDLLTQGTIGNKGYNPNASPVPYANKYLYHDNNFINTKIDSNTKTPNDCPAPIIIIQKELNYTDDNPVANENFKCGANIYSELNTYGYSLNTQEATTQNFSNIYVVNRSAIGGIVGSTCVGARNYIQDSDEVESVGGNKSGCIDGTAFNSIPYHKGGYAIACELDMFNTHSYGTSPTYRPDDYNIYTRPTYVLNCVGYGNTEPVTHAIAIGSIPDNKNGFWNGITFGGHSFLISENDEKKSGVFGTTGLNFASWRPLSNDGLAGGYGFSCIRTNFAVRHWDAIQPLKFNCNSLYLFPRSDTSSGSEIHICSNATSQPALVFETCDNGVGSTANTIENPSRTSRGFIRFMRNNTAIQIVGDNSRIELLQRIDNDFTGVIMDLQNFRPVTDIQKQLGNHDHRWLSIHTYAAYVYTDLWIGSTSLNESQLQQLKALIS